VKLITLCINKLVDKGKTWTFTILKTDQRIVQYLSSINNIYGQHMRIY